mmetsp:Transcript_7818/g.15307  ORF Transcript_7818/g.15307 Transcript_7818/m.15307 type:complete len:104 (-) Transcript_7818:1419-1730(-)
MYVLDVGYAERENKVLAAAHACVGHMLVCMCGLGRCTTTTSETTDELPDQHRSIFLNEENKGTARTLFKEEWYEDYEQAMRLISRLTLISIFAGRNFNSWRSQ